MLGPSLALGCAVVWSLSVILMKKSGASIHPLALNLGKNLLGLAFLFFTAFVLEGHVQWPDRSASAMLLLSGFLGIGVADGLVLRAMQCLTAADIAILECLFAPFVITLSYLFFGEQPTPMMLVGGFFILSSVYFISPHKSASTDAPHKQRRQGIVLMCLGLFLVALGIVMIKPLFESTSLISLVSIRMMAGVAGSAAIFATSGQWRARMAELFRTPHKGALFWGCFLSAYFSIILWIAGYKYLQAGVAALLNQTSTIFTVIFAIFILHEKLTRPKVIAISLALTGIALITLTH